MATSSNPIMDKVNAAKGAMAKAGNYTKSVEGQTPSRFAVKAKPAITAPTPAKADPGLGSELGDKAKNVTDYTKANPPTMHKGGIVPGEKGEDVLVNAQAGEKIIPAKDVKSEGRQSEYRKVYIARRQARSGGGNKPVTETPEKHDQPKAEKGIKEKKA